MLNLVREGEEDYIEEIRYRRRLKIFKNFLLQIHSPYPTLYQLGNILSHHILLLALCVSIEGVHGVRP